MFMQLLIKYSIVDFNVKIVSMAFSDTNMIPDMILNNF